jgi:uncharacterized protein
MQYFGCGWTTTSFQEGHRQVTGEMGPFHAAARPHAGATANDGPVFMVQGAYDVAVRPPAMEWFNQRRNPADKLWYGQFDHGSASGSFQGHPNRRFEQWQYALHAWFDKHLQGRDVDTGPPVEIFVNGERSRSARSAPTSRSHRHRVAPPGADADAVPDVDGARALDAAAGGLGQRDLPRLVGER